MGRMKQEIKFYLQMGIHELKPTSNINGIKFICFLNHSKFERYITKEELIQWKRFVNWCHAYKSNILLYDFKNFLKNYFTIQNEKIPDDVIEKLKNLFNNMSYG
jgi:hypothetical protein